MIYTIDQIRAIATPIAASYGVKKPLSVRFILIWFLMCYLEDTMLNTLGQLNK